jgi:hypothetical protein
MDDGRGLVYEAGAALVVCAGFAILRPAFKVHPLATVLSCLLLLFIVGSALFIHLDRKHDDSMTRRSSHSSS